MVVVDPMFHVPDELIYPDGYHDIFDQADDNWTATSRLLLVDGQQHDISEKLMKKQILICIIWFETLMCGFTKAMARYSGRKAEAWTNVPFSQRLGSGLPPLQ